MDPVPGRCFLQEMKRSGCFKDGGGIRRIDKDDIYTDIYLYIYISIAKSLCLISALPVFSRQLQKIRGNLLLFESDNSTCNFCVQYRRNWGGKKKKTSR